MIIKSLKEFQFVDKTALDEIIEAQASEGQVPMMTREERASIPASCEVLVLDLFVANDINKNDQIVRGEDITEIINTLPHQPVNLEHSKYEILGHIISSGVSRTPQSLLVAKDSEALIASGEKYYGKIAIAVYKQAADYLLKEIRRQEAGISDYYGTKICGSWEINFSNYDILIGKGDDASKYEVAPDADKEELMANHKISGGKGVTSDGLRVIIQARSPIMSVGAALTGNPAANVAESKTFWKLQSELDEEQPKKLAASVQESQQEEIKLPTSKRTDVVKATIENIMFENYLPKINDVVAKANLSGDAALSLSKEIEKTLNEAGREFKSSKEKLEETRATQETALASNEKELTELKAEVEKLKASVQDAEDKETQRQINETFQARMETVKDTFEVSDSQGKFIASRLKSVATDEEFNSYVTEELSSFLSKKSEGEVIKGEIETVELNASEAALAQAKPTNSPIDSNLEGNKETLFDRLKNSSQDLVEAGN